MYSRFSNQICFHVNCQQNSKNDVKSNPHMEVLSIGFKSIIYVCDFSVDVPVHVIGCKWACCILTNNVLDSHIFKCPVWGASRPDLRNKSDMSAV